MQQCQHRAAGGHLKFIAKLLNYDLHISARNSISRHRLLCINNHVAQFSSSSNVLSWIVGCFTNLTDLVAADREELGGDQGGPDWQQDPLQVLKSSMRTSVEDFPRILYSLFSGLWMTLTTVGSSVWPPTRLGLGARLVNTELLSLSGAALWRYLNPIMVWFNSFKNT